MREQPVPFSHTHDVSGLGIDGLCHAAVAEFSFAGMPSTKSYTTAIRSSGPMPPLQPVHQRLRTDRPIAWVGVHNRPDVVYFDQSFTLTVRRGVPGCFTPGAEAAILTRCRSRTHSSRRQPTEDRR